MTGEPAAPTWELNVMVRRGVEWSAEIITGRASRVTRAGVMALFAFGDGVRVDAAGERLAVPARATLLANSATGFALTLRGRTTARVALVHLGLATPGGSVTVLGTKFALTAADTHQSTVRVTRGTVRLADSSGREAEVKTGFECGIALAGYNDIKVGDVIETYEVIEEAATL